MTRFAWELLRSGLVGLLFGAAMFAVAVIGGAL